MKSRILALLILFSLLFSANSWAGDDDKSPKLNKIHVTLHGEKWVETTTAKVLVSVDAILDRSGLEQTHKTMQAKLLKIAPDVAWHITQFDRVKDSSGLEKVRVFAEARVPESALPGLRDRAEKVSRPGEKFEIINVLFIPSFADMEKTREKLRAELYEKANQELERINKVYSDQKYFVHSMQFGGIPMPQPKAYRAEVMAVSRAAPVEEAGITVSNKVYETVYVIFGSTIK